MNIISAEATKSFLYLRSSEKGYGIFISQVEAFGRILFKSGSHLVFDQESRFLQCSDEGSNRVRLDGVDRLLFEPLQKDLDDKGSKKACSCSMQPSIDEIFLSEVEGVHISALNVIKNFPSLNRELIALSEREVLDFIRVFPVTLMRENGKVYCVTGIYSFLLAKQILTRKQKVPVRWYVGRKGKPLRRLIVMELLVMPLAFSMNKSLLHSYYSSLKPVLNTLYSSSTLAEYSLKQFSFLFGIDPRTLKGGGNA